MPNPSQTPQFTSHMPASEPNFYTTYGTMQSYLKQQQIIHNMKSSHQWHFSPALVEWFGHGAGVSRQASREGRESRWNDDKLPSLSAGNLEYQSANRKIILRRLELLRFTSKINIPDACIKFWLFFTLIVINCYLISLPGLLCEWQSYRQKLLNE